MITKCFFKQLVCFRCRLAEFEAEFDANPLLLHISNIGRSVRSQNSTNTTLKNAQKKHTRRHSTTPLGRLVHKGYSSRYLEAHNCTTSGFRAAFKFRKLLGCTTYVAIYTYMCLLRAGKAPPNKLFGSLLIQDSARFQYQIHKTIHSPTLPFITFVLHLRQ
jgi:hypothetical protein